jgi:hypothetical protein
MHFGTKSYLKSNRNHTAKQTLKYKTKWTSKTRGKKKRKEVNSSQEWPADHCLRKLNIQQFVLIEKELLKGN